MTGWINVKEETPKHNQTVLAYGGKIRRYYCVAVYTKPCDEGRFWHLGARGKRVNPGCKITHWMPLPEPPKEESK